jgi:amino acid adenylation domain-containing protein
VHDIDGVSCRTFSSLELEAAEPGGAVAGPDDPAYVIYTSGSTGRPKGVVVPHRNVVSLIAATREEFGLCGADVWSWFHSAAFDFSVWEIWGCLLTGGRLVVVSEEVRRSPDDFAALLGRENVTVLNQTPSSFTHLMDVDQRNQRAVAPRLVIFGGEPLDTHGLLRWFERHAEGECRLVNMFGITETTVHVTAQDITRAMAQSASKSVGRPIPGWSVRVVDGRNRVLPLGAIGEIVVGGDGVALGYLNREELTAERFVVDPATGERLYRSGDLGFMGPDGAIDHLGRLDQQIKLRGYRIELGEIRAALLSDPRVVSAAVVVHRPVEADRDSDRLDAYVVLSDGTADTAVGAILDECAERLPGYMVPTTLTALPCLPLTGNGKLDTASLPAPTQNRSCGEPDGAVSPVSELESLVLSGWRSVLGAQTGLDDNFFALGGNSLLAARMVRVIRDKGMPGARPRDLYLHPTPRRFAARFAGAHAFSKEGDS